MQWYEGNIAEAVTKSKADGAVFGVVILGEDDSSAQMEGWLHSSEVQKVLTEGKFVVIRLVGESEAHQQFAQLYTDVAVPSIYLIGDRGLTLEVVRGSDLASTEALAASFQSAWTRHSPPQGASGGGTEAAAAALPPVEDRVDRAQRLLVAKRLQKEAEEAEDKKRKERERRDTGKSMAEMKRWQEEQETKQMVEQRKKDKLEEVALRKKLKEQIAQDRAERNARSNVQYLQEEGEEGATTTTTQAQEQPPAPVDYTGRTRLQFRLPSGVTVSHAFEHSESLHDVRAFLVSGNHVPFRQFSMSVAYPRRMFTEAEYSSTLAELGLVPSAAILILPLSGSSSSSGGGGGGLLGAGGSLLTLIMSYLMLPFTFIYAMFQRAILPPPSSSSTTTTRPSSGAGAGTTTPSSSIRNRGDQAARAAAAELRQRGGNNQGNSRQSNVDGNIHRLRTQESDSDDEDKATWNGNSTQQM